MDKGQIISGGLVISGSDPSIVLDPVEEALDLVSILVEIVVYLSLYFTVTTGWYDRLCSNALYKGQQSIGVIALVGDHGLWVVGGDQRLGLVDIRLLARGEYKQQWIA